MFECGRSPIAYSAPHRLCFPVMLVIHGERSGPVQQAKQERDEKCALFLLSVAGTQTSLAISFPGFFTSLFPAWRFKTHAKTHSSLNARASQFTRKRSHPTDLERRGQAAGWLHSKIPSIFDHRVRNSSTIKSNYQQTRGEIALSHSPSRERRRKKGTEGEHFMTAQILSSNFLDLRPQPCVFDYTVC